MMSPAYAVYIEGRDLLMRLFTPISIGKVELDNRIVMPSMSLMLADVTGQVTQRLIDYYLERARGGVGLIITEATCIDSPVGKLAHPIQLTIDNDKYIQGLYDLVNTIHITKAKIFCQLHHAGAATSLESTEGAQPVSASSIETEDRNVKTKSLTTAEVRSLVDKFAKAAFRAKLAGFDGVELHSAHGYLIQQFLSPHTNKRTDRYGGDFEARIRFLMEIVQRTRTVVGSDFPIGVRLSADEFIDDGLKISDTMKIAQQLQSAGINILHISAGAIDSPPRVDLTSRGPYGCYVHLAEKVKEVVDIPVIAVGRIKDPLFAEKILTEGRADLVAMGRALIADPEMPNKTRKHRFDTIGNCITCNIGCVMRYTTFFSGCTVNPFVGREREYRIEPATEPKTVLVAGGGPAGMEAAIVSAERGHQVFLFEKTDRLGGQLNLSIVPPHKLDLKDGFEYLLRQIETSDITVRLGEQVNGDVIHEINPEVLVDATGARPAVPEVPGLDQKNVVTAWDVLAGNTTLSGSVVIVGGGMVGCETAEFLAEKGLQVSIVEMLPVIASETPYMRPHILESLNKLGTKIFNNVKLIDVEQNSVILSEKHDGKRKIEMDYLVLACGSKPNKVLSHELKDFAIPTYQIGDCVKPRFLLQAIHEGFKAGLSL